jgi:hypothetical protein
MGSCEEDGGNDGLLSLLNFSGGSGCISAANGFQRLWYLQMRDETKKLNKSMIYTMDCK